MEYGKCARTFIYKEGSDTDRDYDNQKASGCHKSSPGIFFCKHTLFFIHIIHLIFIRNGMADIDIFSSALPLLVFPD